MSRRRHQWTDLRAAADVVRVCGRRGRRADWPARTTQLASGQRDGHTVPLVFVERPACKSV